jgi:biopolymer transport protein ExbD
MISVQKKRRANRKKELSLDMAPLIDMVFILLIFFIVSSTFSPATSVDISRPEVSVVSVVPSQSLMIAIDKSENILIEGNALTLLQVESQVRQAVQKSKDMKVLVLADKKVSIETVLKTLDACRKAGVEASIAAKESE